LEDPRHMLDLIKSVRPKAALFTTYTFSVSHFDAVFLPVLRSVGCQDISVLVDADEAAGSVEESHSRAAGRVYRVAPVIAPGGGVFHPKLAYLAAEEDDVLAVGSGNLTASGQSIQLESFDAVSARSAPTVFRELAEWMQLLASRTQATSWQASQLLAQAAPRARQAYRRNSSTSQAGKLPAPALVQTLTGTARDALEAMFIAEADFADAVTVLSPFHAPDGGPLLRLAASVEAKTLVVGLDGGRRQLVAPFEAKRFKPALPGRFVISDSARNNKPLHAKVFELQAKDKVLVMTGSVNATAQSFESTKNVEVSLARWLPKSPFAWKDAEPQGFEATQEPAEFEPGRALYVDAWLATDRMLRVQLTGRGVLPTPVRLEVHSGDAVVYQLDVEVGNDGACSAGPVPAFDTSKASLLNVSSGGLSASCWLNVHEELDIAAEERERRAAIARVLSGDYAAEDIAEVVRLLSMAAHGMAAGHAAALQRTTGEAKAEVEVEFSFMRWENSGRQRGGTTWLGRNPYELLKALNRWMNADLTATAPGELEVGTSKGLKQGVQLLGSTDGEQDGGAPVADPYALLDKLCHAIPVALERQPELEHGGVLAEVVASRAVDRALKQGLQMAPCISWLDRFSRFSYPESAREELTAVAATMACITANRLEAARQDPQLAMLREAVERVAGTTLIEARWATLVSKGLGRELYRRVVGSERDAVLVMIPRLASAATLDDRVLALLRKASNGTRHPMGEEAVAFPEVAIALRERRRRKVALLRGLLDQKALDRAGCPFCYRELSPTEIATLRQKHVIVHKGITCNELLFFSEQPARLEAAFKELGDA
jgi:hypothetical protein